MDQEKRNELELDLQLHTEGGGGAAAGGAEGGAGEGAGAAEGTAGTEQAQPGTGAARGRRANPLAEVAYGIQDAGQEAAEAQPEAEGAQTGTDPDAEFEELIKGRFKDQFVRRTQGIINDRFRETKQLQARSAETDRVLRAVADRYGLKDAGDLGAIQQALENDDQYLRKEADEKGLTVKQFKELRKLEQENAAFREAEAQRARQEQSQQVYNGWMEQAAQARQIYPDFDLRREANDASTGERFMGLLKSGVDVKTAYEVVHKDELLSGAIGYAVQTAQKRTMDSIRARAARPQENGSGGSVGARIVKNDPSKFTRKDREEISRRVLRGESIKL